MLLNAQTYTHKKHLHPYANIQRRIDKKICTTIQNIHRYEKKADMYTYNRFRSQNNVYTRAVVVVQLVERSLPTPEVHSSNPVIGEIYIEHCLLSIE